MCLLIYTVHLLFLCLANSQILLQLIQIQILKNIDKIYVQIPTFKVTSVARNYFQIDYEINFFVSFYRLQIRTTIHQFFWKVPILSIPPKMLQEVIEWDKLEPPIQIWESMHSSPTQSSAIGLTMCFLSTHKQEFSLLRQSWIMKRLVLSKSVKRDAISVSKYVCFCFRDIISPFSQVYLNDIFHFLSIIGSSSANFLSTIKLPPSSACVGKKQYDLLFTFQT